MNGRHLATHSYWRNRADGLRAAERGDADTANACARTLRQIAEHASPGSALRRAALRSSAKVANAADATRFQPHQPENA